MLMVNYFFIDIIKCSLELLSISESKQSYYTFHHKKNLIKCIWFSRNLIKPHTKTTNPLKMSMVSFEIRHFGEMVEFF